MLLQSVSQLTTLLENNTFTWEDPSGCRPDEVELDAENPEFYTLLASTGEVFGQYRGEMRPPLHITITNAEKANVPLEPLQKAWETIIQKEYYFGNYNFQMYAKGDEGRRVNIGNLLIG